MNKKEYLTVSETITLLGISRPTIYKMIRDGRIRAITTGKKYLIEARSLNANPLTKGGTQRRSLKR